LSCCHSRDRRWPDSAGAGTRRSNSFSAHKLEIVSTCALRFRIATLNLPTLLVVFTLEAIFFNAFHFMMARSRSTAGYKGIKQRVAQMPGHGKTELQQAAQALERLPAVERVPNPSGQPAGGDRGPEPLAQNLRQPDPITGNHGRSPPSSMLIPPTGGPPSPASEAE
jgi:hypothetical protein